MSGEISASSLHSRTARSQLANLSVANPPLALVIVGVLFCLRGIAALWATGVLLVQGYVNVDLTLLCLFVGIGLLRRSSGCRTWALVLLWIGVILTPLAVLSTLPLPGLARYGPLWPIGLLQEMLLLWMLWVLKRADVRRHFEIGAPPPAAIARPHTADSWEAVTDWETIQHRPANAETGLVTAVVVDPLSHAGLGGTPAAAELSEVELNEAIEAVVQGEAQPRPGCG